jgi:hypothetical protein
MARFCMTAAIEADGATVREITPSICTLTIPERG